MAGTPHIGFITTSFPRYRGDPAGSFVFGMARAFAREGYRVTAVVPEPPRRADWSRTASWLEGVTVAAAPYARPRALQTLFFGAGAPDNVAARPLAAFLAPAASVGLLLAAKRYAARFDALVSHWLLPSALVAGAARRGRIRHLAIAHSADVHLLKRLPFRRALAASCLASSDHMGFVSDGMRQDFISLLHEEARQRASNRMSVVSMGVDMDELACGSSRSAIRSSLDLDTFTVLFLGRLVPIKGVDVLISAMSKIPHARLIVAGDGPERARLEASARANDVDARFVGEVNQEKRAELLKACDVLVLPSIELESRRTEGLPMVLVEAMAVGLPVIASDTGAVSELVVDGKTGLLAPPGDAKALAKALALAASEPDLLKTMAKRGEKRAAGRIWKNLIPLYESILLA